MYNVGMNACTRRLTIDLQAKNIKTEIENECFCVYLQTHLEGHKVFRRSTTCRNVHFTR